MIIRTDVQIPAICEMVTCYILGIAIFDQELRLYNPHKSVFMILIRITDKQSTFKWYLGFKIRLKGIPYDFLKLKTL